MNPELLIQLAVWWGMCVAVVSYYSRGDKVGLGKLIVVGSVLSVGLMAVVTILLLLVMLASAGVTTLLSSVLGLF